MLYDSTNLDLRLSRRALLKAAAGLGLTLGISGEASADTVIRVSDVERQVAIETSGLGKKLPFVEWENVYAGPAILQAFRARALDVGSVGGIPPLLAHSTGLDVKIVAFRYRTVPAYVLGVAPGAGIKQVADIKGKKIGFSAGQEQGLYVLQLLKQLGLKKDQVTLVNLISTQFQNALSSRQVDAAPLGEPQLTTYLSLFTKDGAIALRTKEDTTPETITATAEALADPAKFAAIQQLAKAWYAAVVWEQENVDTLIDAYYVKSQHVTKEDGKRIRDSLGPPAFPRNWNRARQMEREANALLTDAGITQKVNINNLFDTRFESLAVSAVPSKYLLA